MTTPPRQHRAPSAARTPRPDGIVIAIDGPAGSGKSSTAKAVAARLGYRHLDSGAFYRALTHAALREGIPPEEWDRLTEEEMGRFRIDSAPAERGYTLLVGGDPVGPELRTPEVNAHVSRMAAVPAVRGWLMDALRRAGERGALVADGRDIGTVVFPDAELKLFLVCGARERARRRLLEQGIDAPSEEEITCEADRLGSRDAMDSGRAVAPLLRAEDAVLLDTSGLSFDAQVAAIVRMAEARASA